MDTYKLTCADHGALNELRTVVDLMSKGYKVFRAINVNAPFDLVAYKDSQLYRIEVRAATLKKDGTLNKCIRDRDEADVYAWVLPTTIIYDPLL